MTRERDRYPRMTLRDRLEELLDWVRGHRLVVVAIALVAVYVITQLILPPPTARPEDLRVGDCLFVPTSASSELGPGIRPIGDAAAVGVSLMSGGADRAGCDASHTYAVVPGQAQSDDGVHRAICLVARADGQWMTHPARGSGE